MEVHRFGIKFFVADPASVRLYDFIQIFHGWIQKQTVENHLLIDVHNYSHIHNGPGILLVAHEGNFSMDMADGLPGLLYCRKTPTTGMPVDHLETILKSALQACNLLAGEVRFRMDDRGTESAADYANYADGRAAQCNPGRRKDIARPSA